MSRASAQARARLFFALWPDDTVRSALSHVAHRAHAECGGRETPADKIHLTLFFLGAVDRTRIPALEVEAASVEGRPFELTLGAVGYWRHNRIAWAGGAEPPAALAELVGQLRVRLSGLGFEAEDRPYVPHVTLVRDAKRPPTTRAFEPIAWRIGEFALVESVPSGGGVRYDVLRRWPLTA